MVVRSSQTVPGKPWLLRQTQLLAKRGIRRKKLAPCQIKADLLEVIFKKTEISTIYFLKTLSKSLRLEWRNFWGKWIICGCLADCPLSGTLLDVRNYFLSSCWKSTITKNPNLHFLYLKVASKEEIWSKIYKFTLLNTMDLNIYFNAISGEKCISN